MSGLTWAYLQQSLSETIKLWFRSQREAQSWEAMASLNKKHPPIAMYGQVSCCISQVNINKQSEHVCFSLILSALGCFQI